MLVPGLVVVVLVSALVSDSLPFCRVTVCELAYLQGVSVPRRGDESNSSNKRQHTDQTRAKE